MAQQVKTLATMLHNLSLILGTLIVEGENQIPQIVSNLHMCAVVFVSMHAH